MMLKGISPTRQHKDMIIKESGQTPVKTNSMIPALKGRGQNIFTNAYQRKGEHDMNKKLALSIEKVNFKRNADKNLFNLCNSFIDEPLDKSVNELNNSNIFMKPFPESITHLQIKSSLRRLSNIKTFHPVKTGLTKEQNQRIEEMRKSIMKEQQNMFMELV